MCDICNARAEKISGLARYFREKIGETALQYYIDMMIRAAESLEELSIEMKNKCHCADPDQFNWDSRMYLGPAVFGPDSTGSTWTKYKGFEN